MSSVQPESTLFGTFADAANEVSGNILVVDPPSGQMQNYISGRTLAASNKKSKHVTCKLVTVSNF